MAYITYLRTTKQTPQNQPIPGRMDQVKNNAGGYVFEIDPLAQLKRFLCLGTIGGTYYVKEEKISLENINNIKQLLDKDYKQVIDLAADYSSSGRVLKNDPALVVFALALSHKDKKVRKYAAEKFSQVVRVPTHLFTFLSYIKELRGWGRLLRETIANWYIQKEQNELVYHVLKYQYRNGWSHKDVLRLSHPKPKDTFQEQLFGWIVGKKSPPKHELIEAFIRLRDAEKLDEVLGVVRTCKIPWEFIPTKWLGEAEVWRALLPNIPFTALIRNLGRLSSLGVLKPFSDETQFVIRKLTNKDLAKKARIHPIQAAVAAKTYKRGKGFRGNLSWPVDPQIVEALDQLTYNAFECVEPTNKKYFIGLDVSDSMTWYTVCDVLNCMEAAVITALSLVKAEKNVFTGAFSGTFQDFPIMKNDTVISVFDRLRGLRFGGTDCAQPMLYALKHKIPVDIFVILTDNETWYGKVHPCQALDRYRQKMGIPAKLAVVGMTATRFSIADPDDPYQLDFVGFDTDTPRAIAEFAQL